MGLLLSGWRWYGELEFSQEAAVPLATLLCRSVPYRHHTSSAPFYIY